MFVEKDCPICLILKPAAYIGSLIDIQMFVVQIIESRF